jgi:hypothetical protein
VSGGSYNHLYSRLDSSQFDAPIATDIRRMGERLLASGYADAAAATLEILRLAESLTDVWQAVEWADSNDGNEDDVADAVGEWRTGRDANSAPSEPPRTQ